jgi:hypothetical protein
MINKLIFFLFHALKLEFRQDIKIIGKNRLVDKYLKIQKIC